MPKAFDVSIRSMLGPDLKPELGPRPCLDPIFFH